HRLLNNDGNIVIVFRVCSFDVATTWIHAAGFSTPTASSPSNRANRHGPTNSIAATTAANGSFPQPLIRRITPSRNRKRPRSSTAYHHTSSRFCSSVNSNGRPSGRQRFRCTQGISRYPRENCGTTQRPSSPFWLDGPSVTSSTAFCEATSDFTKIHHLSRLPLTLNLQPHPTTRPLRRQQVIHRSPN